MSGFKLLAIRPTKDCDMQFLKNLSPSNIYKFYQDYHFVLDEKENKVIEIQHRSSIPKKLYGENISISAVVGKNGSGKSTLVELFCLFVFCLSKQLNLININDFIETHKLSIEDQNRLNDELKSFKLFTCEIYFLIDNKIYSITKNTQGFERVSFENYSTDNMLANRFKPNPDILKITDLQQESSRNEFLRASFFYSILANYSLYGLNTNETGIWLRSIFHKNDGYQTPIVLNPMRTEGKIDINRLTYLSKSRLLGNVFKKLEEGQKEEESLRSLVNNKIVDKIILELDFRKFTIVDENSLKPEQKAIDIIDIDNKSIYLEFTAKNKNIYKHNYFLLLVKSFFPKNDLVDVSFSNSKIKRICKEYILKKVEDVVKKYPQYKAYKNRVFRSNAKEEIVKQCFNSLAEDFTHSTFKIRQALNFLVYDLYSLNTKSNTYELSTPSKEGIADEINRKREALLNDELEENRWLLEINPSESNLEQNNKDSYRRHSLTNYLPPSFFEIDFEFKDEGLFKDLSSGEKQMIYSINSIIYHLLNLDSIYSMELEDSVSYKYYNIILDEIELYFHPEFQRIYINELIKSINLIKSNNYKFNIIFLTHSPFILSDIPTSNILRLEDGKIENIEEQTYAANVHDLLANDFFLKKGFMGEYAKEKIKDLLRFLTDDEGESVSKNSEKQKEYWNPNLAEEFIGIIGEPLLKYDLKELYLSKFYTEKKIDDEIAKLQELKRKNDNNV
ncbi:hypothetical protein [uncultured Aquimarina sp.]|uniref:hypothetical protein n=1 Tax=uncultured Aquimarina sp. TaxID=575652 RepID=UPI0026386B8B|nr:hypothetical protein [uncultured Aquimarina sp.]